MFIVGLYSTRLARRIGPKSVVVAGCLIVASAYSIMAVAHDHKWQMLVATAVMGVGLGLVYACLSNLIVVAVPPEQTGVASGMNANIRTIGGSIGAAVVATIVTATILPNGLPSESGYTRGFVTMALALVAAAAVGLIIPRFQRSEIEAHLVGEREHPELGIVAAGTLIGDKSE
jgi:MFS family permease